MTNQPPYQITVKAADYLTKIAETITRLEYGTGFKRDIKIHRENRVRSIYSSLAIEGNSLSLDEVTDVIDGKFVEKFVEKDVHREIIRMMINQPTISAKAMAEKIGMTQRGVQKNIENIKKAGLVEREGSAKGGSWVVNIPKDFIIFL
jgi:predicted HTH transcriptional regulator